MRDEKQEKSTGFRKNFRLAISCYFLIAFIFVIYWEDDNSTVFVRLRAYGIISGNRIFKTTFIPFS
jgi:hypothetical protein